MQMLLASAKTMRETFAGGPTATTQPRFLDEARSLALRLSAMTVDELATALHCSKAIAADNHRRYGNFFNDTATLPAMLAYNGQAFRYLRADDLTADEAAFAQSHLFIVSFLYGLLRPLDAIHAYRLEGKADVAGCGSMFDYWRDRLTDTLIEAVKGDDGVLVHLATKEFERMFHWKRVTKEVRVVQPLFLVDDGDRYRTVSMYAKGCRGAMARYIIKNQPSTADGLKAFTVDGFTYQPQLGDDDHPHFIKQ